METNETKNQSVPPVLCVLGNQLDATLGLSWPDTLETARAGLEDVPPEELPPLSRQQTELAMEILKILFNITFDTSRRKIDEVQKVIWLFQPCHYQCYTDNYDFNCQKSLFLTTNLNVCLKKTCMKITIRHCLIYLSGFYQNIWKRYTVTLAR